MARGRMFFVKAALHHEIYRSRKKAFSARLTNAAAADFNNLDIPHQRPHRRLQLKRSNKPAAPASLGRSWPSGQKKESSTPSKRLKQTEQAVPLALLFLPCHFRHPACFKVQSLFHPFHLVRHGRRILFSTQIYTIFLRHLGKQKDRCFVHLSYFQGLRSTAPSTPSIQ